MYQNEVTKCESGENKGCCSFFKKSHYGLFKSTPSGKFLSVNPALVKMLGYDNEKELLNVKINQDLFYHPYEKPRPDDCGSLYVARLKKKDGSTIWVEIDSWVNTDEENDSLYYEGIVREINEHKKIIKDLYNAREKFKITLQSIGDGVIVTDTEGKVVMLNEVAEKLTGWNDHEAKGKPLAEIFNIVNEYSRKRVKNPVEKVLSSGKIEGLANHTVLIAKNGSEVPIADSAAPIKNQNDNVFGVVMVFRDVSERRRLINDLKERHDLYRSLFENTGTATLIIEKDTTIAMINREMEKLSGYNKEEIEGKMSWKDFVIPEDQKRLFKYHQQRRQSSKNPPNKYEFHFIDKNGVIKDALITIDLIPNSNKSIASILDITERKQTEERAKYLAYHDKITGLYNRSFLEESLERLDTNRQLPISVIMGDVNGLKLVNDAFGHQRGDQLIKEIGNIIRNSCRHEDIVARWGGDEFIILLPQTSRQEAQKILTRIKSSCSQVREKMINPSIALGLSTKVNTDQDIWNILNEAEAWMYKSKLVESQSARKSIIDSLEKTLWEKDYETEEHAKRLKNMAVEIGRILGLPDNKLDDLVLLASLHDIGKVAIPNTVLLKPDKFTEDEWDTMKSHSVIGYRIVKSSADLAPIAKGILHHHEWWNGAGYPQELRGKEIPLISRIIAIVDAYDVMIHDRPYKKAMSKEEAILELKRSAGIQFDPELVDLFINKVLSNNISGKMNL